MRYDRGRQSLDRHATYIVATFVTVASRNRLDWEFGRGDRSALELRIGQLVALSDHINLMGTNPLVGLNDEQFGPRFPDMTEAYSTRLRQIADASAASRGGSPFSR